MAVAGSSKKAIALLLGQCVPSLKKGVPKIRIRHLELDENLLMYFGKDTYVYANDPKNICQPGDHVLLKQLPKKLTRLIAHEILEVVYPYGDVTDPVTGKKVVVGQYRDAIKAQNKLYGEVNSAFDYDKAPPRGSQKEKRDFSFHETYVKYHEDPDDPQPYAV
ncbi:28S ribosomal protein S17, mitochondrial [Athalia rosae]|uniref:28S ribosomal protein S17, mitochondrial n=1 Tax=Athalia rosae TaxID=37344 RepID=UPI002034399A|nr:28S ribosomal protein S17, mitochondrial [Athalia rosae]